MIPVEGELAILNESPRQQCEAAPRPPNALTNELHPHNKEYVDNSLQLGNDVLEG
jgi:hypothetical protein